MDFYIGTSGWSYSAWQGNFYPEKLEQKWYLPYYTQVFNYVEIDSTFYQIPSKNMVKLWNARTPRDFKFSAKFPRVISHQGGVEKDIPRMVEYDKVKENKVKAVKQTSLSGFIKK